MTSALNETCPHSKAIGAKPSMCSLCIAAATGQTPKKVSFDADGRLMLDGVLINRGTDLETARNVPPNANKKRAAGRRVKTCSVCGSTKHSRVRCDGSGHANIGIDAILKAKYG